PKISDRIYGLLGIDYRRDSEAPCELVAVIGWEYSKGKGTIESISQQVLQNLNTGEKLGYPQSWAADIAAIANTNKVTPEEVDETVRKIITNGRFVSLGANEWPTALSLASEKFASNRSENEVVDRFTDMWEKTGGTEHESTIAVLTVASFISTEEQVIERFNDLRNTTIKLDNKGKSKKGIVNNGSKAFVVLAEVVANPNVLNSEETIRMLIDKHGLKQDEAVRYVLALANQRSANPVLCRQGHYTDATIKVANIEKVMYDQMPITKYDCAAIRLGSK
ncbi:MAG: hypothetical protein ACD_19C00164G0004, partial [uncultured bacterium]